MVEFQYLRSCTIITEWVMRNSNFLRKQRIDSTSFGMISGQIGAYKHPKFFRGYSTVNFPQKVLAVKLMLIFMNCESESHKAHKKSKHGAWKQPKPYFRMKFSLFKIEVKSSHSREKMSCKLCIFRKQCFCGTWLMVFFYQEGYLK